jgi:2-polyprenylphenol hydroxylase and related flavodoxin oxidoreductases
MFCRVIELIEATASIWVVRLQIVSGGPYRFSAGQYGLVTFGEQRPREYSMANCPDDDILEFHVRHASTGGASAYVARELRVGEDVRVEGPFGHAWLRTDHPGPILAIAGGSGVAPIKSIVETAVRRHVGSDLQVFIGARDDSDLYIEPHFRTIAAAHPRLRLETVVADPSGPTARRIGTVLDAVAQDVGHCAGMKAYVAGPSAMVAAAVDLLLGLGLHPEDLHSDLFDPVAFAGRAAGQGAG